MNNILRRTPVKTAGRNLANNTIKPTARHTHSRRISAIIITSGIFAVISWAAFLPPYGFLTHASATFIPSATVSAGAGAITVQLFANALTYFIVLCCLFKLAWIDHETMEIPDRFHIIIGACGLLILMAGTSHEVKSHLIGIGIASVPLFVIMIVCLLVCDVEAFGFGDVKLMAAAGFFLGWQHTLVALFIGIIIGGIYGSYLLAMRKKRGREHFAFGPALCIGIGIAMFAADSIIEWYLRVL